MRILVLILIALMHGFAAFWVMRGYGGPGLGWLLTAAAGVGVVIGAVGLVMRRAWGYWIGTAVNLGMIAVAGFMAYSGLNSAAAHVLKGVWIAALAVAAQAGLSPRAADLKVSNVPKKSFFLTGGGLIR